MSIKAPAAAVGSITSEESIIWLCPRNRYVYLREKTAFFAQRRVFPKSMKPATIGDGEPWAVLVAYSVLSAEARAASPGSFVRRYWLAKKGDPLRKAGRPASGPMEAVEPGSIRPGFASRPLVNFPTLRRTSAADVQLELCFFNATQRRPDRARKVKARP